MMVIDDSQSKLKILTKKISDFLSVVDYNDIAAISGHRYIIPTSTKREREHKSIIAVKKMKKDGHLLLNGGAVGWDMDVLVYSYLERLNYIIVLPFRSRKETLIEQLMIEYPYFNSADIINNALGVVSVDFKTFNKSGFFIRNQAMVELCDVLHVYYDDNCVKGGTYHAIQYAKRLNSKRKKQIKIYNWYNGVVMK